MKFNDHFPKTVPLILGILQMLLTCAIIALEVISVYIDVVYGTVWNCEQLCCSRTSIGSFNNQTGMATLNCTQQLLQGMAPTCPAYPSRKLILIQSQLGYAAAMAATCVTYVVTYIWVSCMACCKK
ncbi:unnamed protein product [Didymodactylos carnosus]|uniref:Uncharacterized protein n=1 Tax=Didymodactylos carnosus TaxID=1234261 RepID=A0A814R3W2_9BILA|nr:unnamed protein product [Didymodactylos carnosus]CAF3891497.1 unnamed protein product [Didymodactylos carnosus]